MSLVKQTTETPTELNQSQESQTSALSLSWKIHLHRSTQIFGATKDLKLN